MCGERGRDCNDSIGGDFFRSVHDLSVVQIKGLVIFGRGRKRGRGGVMMTETDQRQDGELWELRGMVKWLMRGVVGLMVGLGVLGWWVLLKGCG